MMNEEAKQQATGSTRTQATVRLPVRNEGLEPAGREYGRLRKIRKRGRPRKDFDIGTMFHMLTFTYAGHVYRLVDLGLQESDRSEAVAVNDNGQVAGTYWMFGNKYYFIWAEKNGITLISLPETAIIRVLNNAGQIAGNYQDLTGKNRGFIWDDSLGFRDLGTLGGSYTHVYDMNNLGQVVGESESKNISLVDGAKEQHAFMWQNDSMVDLGALAGDLGFLGDRSVATSINDHGQIIGTSNRPTAHKVKLLRTNNRAVAWLDGVIEEIEETIDHEENVIALSINNDGLAVYHLSQGGNFVIDILEKIKTKMSSNLNNWLVEMNDNGDLLLLHEHMYAFNRKKADRVVIRKENASCDYVAFYRSFNNPKQWKIDSFHWAHDFNNKCWVVGEAENIYGEHHGVLLVPINE